MTSPDTTYVLPPDVLVIPAGDLDGDVRSRMEMSDREFALTRPRARIPSKVVDADTARLLEQFREPSSIVEAVVRYSTPRHLDSEHVLEAAYPMLRGLTEARLLLRDGEEGSEPIEAAFHPGDRFAGFEVLRLVHVFEDTELYRARQSTGQEVALKLARPPHADTMRSALQREAALLEGLANAATPGVVAFGEEDGRPYLALEWIDGVPLAQAAHSLRGGASARAHLLDLAVRVVETYAELHAAHVLHSDVHPGNVLVDKAGSVVLLDFGLSRRTIAGDPLASAGRGGISTYFEPEYAAAVLNGQTVPPSTAEGEQFSVAALVYSVLCGQSYVNFPFHQRDLLRAIVEQPVRAFSDWGQEPWSDVESVLSRALAKSPADRFPSMAAFADALGAARSTTKIRRTGNDLESEVQATAEEIVARTVERARPNGELGRTGFIEPPRSSVNFGAAGLAYALLRMATIREDGELLALADYWSARAVQDSERDGAFYNPQLDLPREILGSNTLYHTASGVWLVRALVARAQLDQTELNAALQSFGQAANTETDNLDVALGQAGIILGCALLAEVETDVAGLREFGDGRVTALWRTLEGASPRRREERRLNLGMAHGWAGVLFATLRWARAVGAQLPAGFEANLGELVDCGIPAGDGMRWPWFDGGSPNRSSSMVGWCNGSAGFVFLWSLASRHWPDGRWLELARRTAQHAFDGRDGAVSLCCGALGSAWAMLDLARAGGGDEWVKRAQELFLLAAARADQLQDQRDSLYKGELALALLAAEILRPEDACMPMFGELEPH